MLVSIAVVLILLSIALPALRSARDEARAVACRVRIGQLGQLLMAYANSNKSAYPTWVTDGPSTRNNPDLWRHYSFQWMDLFHRVPWMQFSGLDWQNPIYRCPAAQPVAPTTKFWYNYEGVPSMYVSPGFVDPDLPPAAWVGRLGADAQSHDDVLFPSDKIGLFEDLVFHGWRGTYQPGVSVVGLEMVTSDRPMSAWFFDGHVEGVRYQALPQGVYRRPLWQGGRMLNPFGSEGRDRPGA